MLIRSFNGISPTFGERVFVARTAVVVGDVTLGDDVSVWYNVVLRGDIHWIRVGDRSNLQDGVIVHVENGISPTLIEEEVSIGHGSLLHGCTIRRGSLVGMGATILNDAEIGENCLVAAGAVVREGFRAQAGSLIAGVPAVVKRSLTDEEAARVARTAVNYLGYKSRHMVASDERFVDNVDDLEAR